jgi:hypothetical protein
MNALVYDKLIGGPASGNTCPPVVDGMVGVTVPRSVDAVVMVYRAEDLSPMIDYHEEHYIRQHYMTADGYRVDAFVHKSLAYHDGLALLQEHHAGFYIREGRAIPR